MTPNRRAVLCASLGVTAGLTPTIGGATPAIARQLIHDPDVLNAAAIDFGRIVHRLPGAVHRPASSTDIADLLHWAGQQGLKVAARGQGHSTYGRAQAAGGIVVDMSTLRAIGDIRPDRIVVDAGATWKDVFEAALVHGLTPPVLTNYLGLSIGGTIAVGGIGGSSSRYGMQTDQVLELDVVTGEGRELRCSPTENADLFDAVRAGLGKCAIVTRATLRLMRAPDRVRRFQLFYPDLSSLTAELRAVLAESRFDQLQGAILPDGAGGWRYHLEGAVFHDRDAAPDDGKVLAGLSDNRAAAVVTDLAYRDDALAFDRLENVLRQNGQWFNAKPWLLSFLRGSNAEQVVRPILDGLTGDDIGPFVRLTYYPVHTAAFDTPLVRLPAERIAFPFNLIRIPASDDMVRLKQAEAKNRALYDRIRDAGGMLYPVSAFPMSPDDWKDHFGPRWALLRSAKQRHDPNNMLTPGYDVI